MFRIYEDLAIHVTRGDMVCLTVTAEENGESYVFQPGDVLRFKVFEKKNCANVVLQKEFAVTEAALAVPVLLTGQDTKIGGIISKPVDYWYEIELNPFTQPRTIVGYDCAGPKVFRLLPEGRDLPQDETEEADIPVVDNEMDMTSPRPVQNQAISRALLGKLSLSGGTMTGPIAMDGYRISGLGAAAAEADAVNLAVMNAALTGKAPASHVSDAANPHKVTAAQAGARPSTWLPSITEIGAAPAGFGLGVGSYNDKNTSLTAKEQLDALTGNSFWAYRNINDYLISGDKETRFVYGINYVYSSLYSVQIGYCVYTGTMIKRIKVDSVWYDWEYENPSMTPGVEYRTTQRYHGKVVYAQAVNTGSFPNASTKTIDTTVLTYPIYQPLMAYGISSVDNRTIPHSEYIKLRMGWGYIELTTTDDYSSDSAVLAVLYIKQ